MNIAMQRLHLLVGIRQSRVEVIERQRQAKLNQLTEQQAVVLRKKDQLQQTSSLLRQEVDKAITGGIKAADLILQDQYKHSLGNQTVRLEAEVKHEEIIADAIVAELKEVTQKLRQAKASLEVIERQLKHAMRQQKKRLAKKEEMNQEELSINNQKHGGAVFMNFTQANKVDANGGQPRSVQPAKPEPKQVEQQRFEQMLEKAKSGNQDATSSDDDSGADEGGDLLATLGRPVIAQQALQSLADNKADAEADAPLSQLQLNQNQTLAGQAPAMEAHSPASASKAEFIELMTRHVQQWLVSEPTKAGAQEDQQMFLRMSDRVLPNTQIVLTRTLGGWNLKAQSSGQESLDLVSQSSDSLVKRFSAAGLGNLQVETEFQYLPSKGAPR